MDIRFDFNSICDLEDMELSLQEIAEYGRKKPFKVIRALLYVGADFPTLRDAGDYIQSEGFENVQAAVMQAWGRDLPLVTGSTSEPEPSSRRKSTGKK